ncbi:hypothetical protein EDB19DRAFT_1781574 [Suillus lakei]|nr:hypothetical protein EDB19DRAFT_1781574 [Suillus lakei]
MEMGPAHHNPMDAQRFDPLRRTRTRLVSLFKTSTSKLMMGQGLHVRTERASMGNAWPDHDVVVDALEGGGSDSEGSCPSTPSSTYTSTTDTQATSPTAVDVPPSHDQKFDVYDRDGIIVTRTIIRPHPNPHRDPTRTPSRLQMVLARMFSRSPSPTIHTLSPSALPRSTPASCRTSPVLQALNCFSTSSTFDSDVGNMQVHERKRPVLQVIVMQTRERYEDDMAFKEIVGSVLPAAGVRGLP